MTDTLLGKFVSSMEVLAALSHSGLYQLIHLMSGYINYNMAHSHVTLDSLFKYRVQ